MNTVPGALRRYRVVPFSRQRNVVDRVIARVGIAMPMRCPVCGRFSLAVRFNANLRESGVCVWCRSTNRQRQLAWTLAQVFRPDIAAPGLGDVPGSLVVFNTEARGPLHRALAHAPGYLCSEFLGDEYRHGEEVRGTRHEDLQELSFGTASIDVVVSSDVLEHVPDPYKAHREIYRVLRAGGAHVFTVPFLDSEALDQERSRVDDAGMVVHLQEPMYHIDPLRDGALVYRLFGLEMFVRLQEIGFRTSGYNLHSWRHGIVGENAFVFVAEKPPTPPGS